jgi:hypothetical protein
MPPKKKPVPLHVSRARIEAERPNVVKRTQRRIDLLRATEKQRNDEDEDEKEPVVTSNVDSHCCMKIFCFFCSRFTTKFVILNSYKPFVCLYLFECTAGYV